MRLARGIVGCLLTAGVLLTAACHDDDPREGYIVVGETGDDGRKLTFLKYGAIESGSVDVTGLDVDMECAQALRFGEAEDLRIALLRNGCATTAGDTASDAEKAAQAAAQKEKLGHWDDSEWAKVTTAVSTFLSFLGSWIRNNGKEAFGLFSGLIGILSTFWFIRAYYNKKVVICLIGLPGAGKTDLWTAWRSGSAPSSNAQPTTGRSRPQPVRPVNYGKYTLSPVVIDSAGLEPHHSIDEFRRARFKFRWKRKLVLVVVLAPRPENIRNNADPEIDHDYLEEQKGYVALVDGLIGGRRRRSTPDAVVMFVTKFDLLSQNSPGDSSSDGQRDRIEAAFTEHRRRIEKFCKKPDIPVHWIVGSAKRGWGITELRDSIQQIVS